MNSINPGHVKTEISWNSGMCKTVEEDDKVYFLNKKLSYLELNFRF